MKQIPVNRWTVGAVAAILAFFGSDFIAPILKAIAVISSPYVPAV